MKEFLLSRSANVLVVSAFVTVPPTCFQITMIKPDGNRIDRLPAWIQRVTQDLSVSPTYDAIFWNPPTKYEWKNKAPRKPTSLKVYEAHGTFMMTMDG